MASLLSYRSSYVPLKLINYHHTMPQVFHKNAVFVQGFVSIMGKRFCNSGTNNEPHKIPEQRKAWKKVSSLKYPRIYTRTGDGGTTGLFTGERREKDDIVFDALGTVDELSSHIGLSVELSGDANHPYEENLQRIQCLLQDVASSIATPLDSAKEAHLKRVGFSSRHTKELEEWIDNYSQNLPPLENFILPGGGQIGANLHICRAVCRRAERQVTPLVRNMQMDAEPLKYLNRLSDFLYTVARVAAIIDRKAETIYQRPDLRANVYSSGPDGVWKRRQENENNGLLE